MAKYTPNNKPAYTSYSPTPSKMCCYLLPIGDNKYQPCNKPTKFIMVEEEDGISHREYYSFCDEHLEIVLEADKNDPDLQE